MRFRGALLLAVLASATTARAQSVGELWGNVTIDWLASDRLVYTLDVEPKVQVTPVTKQSRFANVDTAASGEYAVSKWLVAYGEFLTGVTNEQDGSTSLEVTERMGVRLHVLSRVLQSRGARRGAEREAQPRRRGTIATLVRVEHRAVNGEESQATSTWRFRTRLELAYPLNRPKVTSDGALYLTSDSELFTPISKHPQQGQVNQWRLRNGIGYRVSFKTRLEMLYIWTTSKDDTGVFATASHALDVRVKLAF